MPLELAPIHVLLDGQATESATTLRASGPYVVVITTALPQLAVTVVSTYIGADDVETSVVELVLARRPFADRRIRTVPRDELPVTHGRDRCLLDHLARVCDALSQVTGTTVTIDVGDGGLDAASDS